MNKIVRTAIHIRRADEEIFRNLSKLHYGFGRFVSDMMNQYGSDYIDTKVREQVKELNKLTNI